MNTPLQKSIACTPRPQTARPETLARLHQTRVGDWSKVMESARQQRRDKEALSALHDLSPAEYAQQAQAQYRPVSRAEGLLTRLGNYAFSWQAWAVLGVIALVLMGMFGVDAARTGAGR